MRTSHAWRSAPRLRRCLCGNMYSARMESQVGRSYGRSTKEATLSAQMDHRVRPPRGLRHIEEAALVAEGVHLRCISAAVLPTDVAQVVMDYREELMGAPHLGD